MHLFTAATSPYTLLEAHSSSCAAQFPTPACCGTAARLSLAPRAAPLFLRRKVWDMPKLQPLKGRVYRATPVHFVLKSLLIHKDSLSGTSHLVTLRRISKKCAVFGCKWDSYSLRPGIGVLTRSTQRLPVTVRRSSFLLAALEQSFAAKLEVGLKVNAATAPCDLCAFRTTFGSAS